MTHFLIVLALQCGGGVSDGGTLSLNQRLIAACYQSRLEDVASCLRKGAEVNATFGADADEAAIFRDPRTGAVPLGTSSWTPLIAAAAASFQSDPPATQRDATADDFGESNVEVSALRSETKGSSADGLSIVYMLLSHGAELDRADDNGATALYKAVTKGKTQMVGILLRFGANPNTRTEAYIDGPDDITPLHRAARSKAMVQLLLDYGANAAARDSTGQTVADWVRRNPRRDFDLLFDANGAKVVTRQAAEQ